MKLFDNHELKNELFDTTFGLMKSRKGGARSAEVSSGSGDEQEDVQSYSSKKIQDEQDEILNMKHPLELSGLINGKSLTVAQRAIMCCINRSMGSASENVILRFLKKHWKFIKKNSTKDYRDTANLRVVKINVKGRKNGYKLFTEVGEHVWAISQCAARPEPKRETGDKFEDRCISSLQTESNGLTIDELTEKCRDFIRDDGYFRDIVDIDRTGMRRIRSILLLKRRQGEVKYDPDTDKWSVTMDPNRLKKEEGVERLPEFLHNVNIADMTLSELYKMVKKNSEDGTEEKSEME